MFREKFKEQKLKARNPYEEIRDKVMDFLHKTFKQHLGTIPSTWKQSEIYYFDDVDILKQRIVGAPRNAAQMSLKFPWNYIQAEDLKPQSEEEIHGIFPDVCIGKVNFITDFFINSRLLLIHFFLDTRQKIFLSDGGKI